MVFNSYGICFLAFYFDSVVNQIYVEGKFAIPKMNAAISPTLFFFISNIPPLIS